MGSGGGGLQSPPDPNPPTPVDGSGNETGGATETPIVLDLSGSGLAVTQLSSSNTFAAIDTDGYEHRTAWAGAGSAVLFVDPNGLDTIRDADQYIFTDWDPSASSDMQALRDVFDTNHDGKLDAGDAAFGQFKLMVTNADGTTSVETLAQAGITSIDLTANTVTQNFADGSSIDGETTFTRADGTTGTVASMTFAADATGYAVKNTTTANADGSTTVDNRALNANGSLASDTASTTSVDGLSRIISYDDDGLGVIDRTQFDDTVVNVDGSRTETVSNRDGQGQLTSSITTTTSANGTTVTIARDLTGGGVTNQTETRQTGADGTVTDTLTDVAANGTTIDQTVTTASADGLAKLTQVDSTGRVDADGNDVFDRTTQDTTAVNPDGSRTETVSTVNADGSQVSSSVIVTSADALTRTSSIDRDGDGTTDQVQVAQTTDNSDGSVTTTTTTFNGDGSQVLGTTVTTLSADGLSKTTQMDMDGDGIVDRTTSDFTSTNVDGGQSEDVSVASADGTALSKVLTVRGTDGISRDTTVYDGSGDVLSSDKIGVGSQGATQEDAASFGTDGTLLHRTETITAADGLTTTTETDTAGNGTFDRTTVDQTTENADGSATEIAGTRAANGTLLGRTVVDTSVDGLTTVTRVDATGAQNPDGTAVFDRVTTDATSYATDGSRIRSVTATSRDGTLLSSVTTDTGSDRQSHSVTTDANGDGFTTTLEQVTTAADGTVTDSITDFNPDGSTVDSAVRTTSANGLSITTQIDAAGTGTYNRTTTDVTTIADDGQRVEAVTNLDANDDIVGRTVMESQADGDASSMRVDTTGSGTFDHVTNTTRAFNADGSTTVTVQDKSANTDLRDQTVTTTSGDGLSVTTQHDLDGDGAFDQTTVATTAYAADGDVITTTTDLNGDGTDATLIRDQTVSTVSGDGRTTTSQTSHDGSVDYSTTEALTIGASGSHYDDVTVFDADAKAVKETLTTTAGNGLTKTTQVDVNGDGTFDTTMVDATVLNADGSSTETVTASGSAGLNGRSVTTTSGNGLSKTVQSDTAGTGVFDTTTQDATTLNADGSRLDAYTVTDQDGSVRSSTSITTSADQKHVAIARTLGTDGSQSETIDRGANGAVTDALADKDGTGQALGGETVTTSANGLVKSATYTDANGAVQDTQIDTRVLDMDGSTTEQFSDSDSAAGVGAVFRTNTSGDGLVRTTAAQFSNLPLTNYSTLDTTTLNDDGSLNDTIKTSNSDGSIRDESVRTVSADGLITTAALDDDAEGHAEITDQKVTATDGSSVHTTTTYNSVTHAQDRQDVVITTADGRITTLESARDGDPTARYTEQTIEAADGTISDKSQFTSGTLAPSYTQIRSQTLDTTGGQTVVISDYDANGGLEDQATTTVSGNGLVTQTELDTTGDGTNDLVETDSTVINADGSRLETIKKTLAPGVSMSGPGTTGYERTIATSADGLTVTTATDDDGNGAFEKTETSVRGIDGSLTDTVTFNDNSSTSSVTAQAGNGTVLAGFGVSVMAEAIDGTMSAGIVKTTSADGLVVTTKVGDITTQRTYVAGSNGSYTWTQNLNGLYAVPSASHNVDVNGVDTWTSSYVPDANSGVGPNTTTTIRIDTAQEQAAVAQANSIYQTVLDRPMMDAEQESLIQYIQGGILDRQALAKSLIASNSLGASFGLNFIQTSYENDFGHDASASDTAAFLKEYQTEGLAAVAVDIAEKAVNEQAGNGLLALLPGGPQATPMTVTLISPQIAAATNTGANYAAFVNAIGTPSGDLTPGQISQFAALTGDAGATTAPQINFVSASSSTSGQGTAVPEFFSSPSTPAKAPGGGAAGPLVVNLAGAKVHTTDLATSTMSFDDTGSGTASTTAWTTPDEGFLVLDPADAAITDGSSMISTFSALAQYDADGDGTLTAAEADAAGVKIWVDANGDGGRQSGEIETLGQAGIASIDLKDTQTGSYDNGNIIAADSSFTFTNGQTGDVADAWLAYGGALSQGAVYQFGDDVVIRAADGTASELLYGSGETLDAGAVGLSRVVDTGGNNILQGSNGANVTLSGAAGDQLVGGSGADTLLAIGDGETVKTGSGTTSVDVSGSNTTVDASLGTSTISLDGANDHVIGGTWRSSIAVNQGVNSFIAGVGSNLTIEAGGNAEISGSSDKVSAVGHSAITFDASGSTLNVANQATVAINGSDNVATLGKGSSVTVAGTADAISLNSGLLSLNSGASIRLTGNNNKIGQAGSSTLMSTGANTVVDVNGAGVISSLSNGDIDLESGSSATIKGIGNQIVQNANSTLAVLGDGSSLVVTGNGTQATLSNARVALQSGSAAKVEGDGNVISATPADLSSAAIGSINPAQTSVTEYTFNQGLGSDTFVYSRVDGDFVINAADESFQGGRSSTLKLSDLNAADVTLSRDQSNDLIVTVNATGQSVTVTGEFDSARDGIQLVAFADGTILNRDQIIAAAPLRAGTGDVTLQAPDGTISMVAGAGNDIDHGGNGNDTFVYAKSDGNLTIQDHDSSFLGTNVNKLQLSDLNAADITLSRDQANDLIVTVNSTGRSVTVTGEFNSARDGVQLISFADGSTWDKDQIIAAAPLQAGTADVTLNAPDGNVTMVAGVGNDTLVGGGGNDTFVYSKVDGDLVIKDHDASFQGGESNTLQLSDLNVGDVTLSRDQANDLVLTVNATGRTVTVLQDYSSGRDGVQRIVFADGTVLNQQIAAVNAPPVPTANILPDSASTTDLTQASGLTIGDYGDSRNDETVLWSSTGGSDIVTLHDYNGPERSTLNLGDLKASDVTLTRVNEDLQIIDKATGAILTVSGQFANNNMGVASIAFADGSALTGAALTAPYRPTANILPDSASTTDLTQASGLTIGDYGDSRNDETVLWSSTGGSDIVTLHDYNGPERSTLNLGDLKASDVTLTRVNEDLQIIDKATGAILTVSGQFANNNMGVASIAFADGSALTGAALTAPYRPTTNILPDSASTTDLTQASGLTIGDYGDSRNDETVLWSSTGGSDIVTLHDYNGPERSTLNLGDLKASDVTLTRVNEDLQIIDKATGAILTVSGQFANNNMGVASIAFADGSALTGAALTAPYRPTANILPDSASTTDLIQASGLTIGDYGDSRNDETVLWSSTGGSDIVTLHDYNGPERSTLNLGDLKASDVTLTRVNEDLQIIDKATGAILTVSGQFANNNMGVASIAFADGSALTGAALTAPYRPTANILPDSASTTDLTQASGLTIGDYGDSRNDETVLWSSTGGSDIVTLHDYNGPERSTLNLGDLKASDVTLTRVNEDLQIIDKATGAILTVSGQFANNNMGVASIAFADGSALTGAALTAPYRPTANILPDSASTTDLTQASGLTIGDYGDSRNDETVLWSSTGGSDIVTLHDYNGPERSTLNLGDLKASDVTLTRVNEDLQIIDKATGAILTVSGQFANNNMGVASIAFADGSALTGAALTAPYRPTANILPDSASTTDLTQASGLTIGDYGDSRNDETVLWSSTGGSDIVTLHDYNGPERSTLNLGDLKASDVTLTRVNEDLQIIDKATGAILTVSGQFANNNMGVASIAFADGSALNSGQIAASSLDIIQGPGSALTTSGSTILAHDGTQGAITGANNSVTLGASDSLTISGSNDTVILNKTDDTVLLRNDGQGVNTVTSGSVSVVQAADGNLSVYGGLASTAVTTSSSTPSIALGSGNVVSGIVVPATITGYGANGLTSWQDLFDTMSGALKETDQYQYNASNSLMEIDKYNGSGSQTEADLYDPQTSAEIGAYLYGSNGHVNEVVDLLHNQDWLSQSDGSYKDKTSGAVSKTQPTLR